jgi:hypothetical protein
MAMSYKQGLHPRFDLGALRQIVKASVKSTPPPAGFDPLTASQDDLKKFAFPVRPDRKRQPAEYAFWQRMFAEQLAFQEFDFDLFPPIVTQARGFSGQSPRRQTSPNWSGAYITPRDGTVFSAIWAEFQVPTPNPPPGGGPSDDDRSSTWIGFDGQRRYYMSTLPQFGTAQDIKLNAGVPVRSFYAWWQWWVRDLNGQAFPIKLTAPAIHAGDLIMCYMQVASDRARVSFMMKNVTTRRFVHFFQDPPQPGWGQPFKVSGATAEWVTERPAIPPNPFPQPLPDYGTVDFRDCGATAVNMRTGATVERSLSGAKLIDMYVVRQNPERTVKISIPMQLDTTEFLTEFQ